MQIETYEQDEVAAQNPEVNEECKALVDQLGLGEQKKFYEQAKEDGAVFPYRLMTTEERNVYGILMPQRTELQKFGDAAIPLRVLQVAAHAGTFEKGVLEVWHQQGAKDDPLLVLRIGDRWSAQTFYLLARWGEVLENFNDLKVKAKNLWLAREKSSFAQHRQKLDCDESLLDNKATEWINGMAVSSPVYCGWT